MKKEEAEEGAEGGGGGRGGGRERAGQGRGVRVMIWVVWGAYSD